MSRKLSIILIVGAVCALGVGGIALAAGGFSRDGGAKDQTLVLLDITKQASFVDVDGSNGPPTPGDEFVSTDVLKTRDGSHVVGHQRGICTFVSVSASGLVHLHCVGTVTLENGSLEFAGAGTATETTSNLHLALTGGTGIYDEVDGQAHVRQIGPDRSLVRIDIDA